MWRRTEGLKKRKSLERVRKKYPERIGVVILSVIRSSSHSMRKLSRSSHEIKYKTTKKHQQVASTLNINTASSAKLTTGIHFIFKQTKWLDLQILFQQYASLTQVPAEVSPPPVHGELLITFHEEVMPATPVSVKISRAASLKRQPGR